MTMAEGVVVAGGTATNAWSVPALEALGVGQRPIMGIGTSSGLMNLLLWASHREKELRGIWTEAGQEGLSWFQAPNILGLKQGLFTMDPLRRKMEKRYNITAKGLRSPLYAGVTFLGDTRNVNVHMNPLGQEQFLQTAIASCTQDGIHEGVILGNEWAGDGGVLNAIPSLYLPEMPHRKIVGMTEPAYARIGRVEHWRILVPHPIEADQRYPKRSFGKLDTAWERAAHVLACMIGNTVLGDVKERIEEARSLGAKQIDFYAPRTWSEVMSPWKLDPEAVAQRFQSGDECWRRGPRISIKF